MSYGKVTCFHPWCENSIAQKHLYNPPQTVSQMARDLEAIPVFLCEKNDLILTENPLSDIFLDQFNTLAITPPENHTIFGLSNGQAKLSFEDIELLQNHTPDPWGWSPYTKKLFSSLLTTQGVKPTDPIWFKKSFSAKMFSELDFHRLEDNRFDKDLITGSPCMNIKEVKEHIGLIFNAGFSSALMKADLAASGQNQMLMENSDHFPSRWINNQLTHQTCIVVEPYLHKICDFSIQLETNNKLKPVYKGYSLFQTLKSRQYSTAIIGGLKNSGLSTDTIELINNQVNQFENENHPILDLLEDRLNKYEYQGPIGIDMMVFQYKGRNFVKSIVEINPRWTMGRIATKLDCIIEKGKTGLWKTGRAPYRPLKMYNRQQENQDEKLKVNNGKISGGVLWVNDPKNSEKMASFLVVGHSIQECENKLKRILTT